MPPGHFYPALNSTANFAKLSEYHKTIRRETSDELEKNILNSLQEIEEYAEYFDYHLIQELKSLLDEIKKKKRQK